MMIGSMLKQSTQLVQDFRMFPRCNSLFRMEVFPTSMTSLRTFALISMISEWQLIQVHVITLEDHWSIQENEEDMEMTWQKHPTAPFTCCNDGDLMYIINRLGTPFFFFPWLLLSWLQMKQDYQRRGEINLIKSQHPKSSLAISF